MTEKPATTEPAGTGLSANFNGKSERKFSVMLPAGAYHFNADGSHAKLGGYYDNNGVLQGGQHYNETKNWGLGVEVPLTDSARNGIPTGVAFDTQNVSAFGVIYRNSYADSEKYRNDHTLAIGINWDPLRAAIGTLQMQAGVTVGVAWSQKGSYPDNNEKFSKGAATLMGGLHLGATETTTGLGMGMVIVPPRAGIPSEKVSQEQRPKAGTAMFYLKKDF